MGVPRIALACGVYAPILHTGGPIEPHPSNRLVFHRSYPSCAPHGHPADGDELEPGSGPINPEVPSFRKQTLREMPGEELPILKKSTEAAGSFLSNVAGGAIGELNAMWADRVRQKRFERALDRLEGVVKKCSEAGIENPREVALTVLVPWLENASLEEDPSLHEMWESLLANASDPRDNRKQGHRSFVRILKQIEAEERKVLEALYELDERSGDNQDLPEYPDNAGIRKAMNEIGFEDSMSDDQLNFAKINLLRLGLCSRGNSFFSVPDGGAYAGVQKPVEPQTGPENIHISNFGRIFYEACQPPERMGSADSGA